MITLGPAEACCVSNPVAFTKEMLGGYYQSNVAWLFRFSNLNGNFEQAITNNPSYSVYDVRDILTPYTHDDDDELGFQLRTNLRKRQRCSSNDFQL